MSREVRWTHRALRTESRLDRPTRHRIAEAIKLFAETGQGDIKRLKDVKPELFRLRVGNWRVFFSEEAGGLLLVRAIRPRGDAY